MRNAKREAEREAFILENQKDWKERGAVYKAMREKKGLPISFVSMMLNISSGRLKRFEEGEGVTDSKLLETAYKLWLENWNLTGELQRTLNRYK
jgi:hypothetical protein